MINKHKNLVYAISFLDLFAVGLVVPLFNNHLRDLGASHTIIGVIGSVYAGTQIISGPLIGTWSDIGDRKKVLGLSLLLCSFCYFSLGIVTSLTAICVFRLLLGFAKHTQGMSKAMISDLFSSNEQSEILSRSIAMGSIAFSIGTTTGGFISELPNGFSYACLLTSLMFILNFFLLTFLPSSKPTHKPNKDQLKVGNKLKEEILEIYGNLKAIDWLENWQSFALRFISGISSALFFHNYSFYMKEYFNLNKLHLAYVISYNGLTQTCTILSLSYINGIFYKNDKSCLRRVFHFFLILSISSCLLFFANNFIVFMVFFLPFTMSASILRVSTMELLLQKSAKDQKGAFSGVSNSIMSFSKFVAPLTSGLITDFIGSHVSMLLPAIPAVFGAFITIAMLKNMKKQS